MPRNCPKCDEILETQEDDPECGINGCVYCPNEKCDYVADIEDDDQYLDEASRET